jgi:predicted ribosome quality control (RQC) complex YloA/Tae2 family protein
MRPLSVFEIQNLTDSLGLYLGKPLQSTVTSGQDLLLGFWEGRRVLWLWLDLNPSAPLLIPMLEPPVSVTGAAKAYSPMWLFLKAHFQGRELEAVEHLADLGRVIRLRFSGDAEIEFRMIPRMPNLIARAEGKQVSLKPITELAAHHQELALSSLNRTIRELTAEWQKSRFGDRPKKSPRAALERKIENTKRSLLKVQEEIASKRNAPFRKLGQWLVENQNLRVPPEFAALVDPRRKLAWNIEQCFHKAKEVERKIEGTEARESELKHQISELERRLESGEWLVVDRTRKVPKAKGKATATSARTLHLTNDVKVIAGKSGKDNLALLKRANAWDVWLHVEDSPSAHALIFRPRGFKISDELLRKAGQWLLKNSFGAKYKSHIGEKYEILVTERRYVSPIKGDHMGRVTCRGEKILTLKFEG